MKKLTVEIMTESPIHLGSGKADVIVDAEVVHDSYGMPYFPGKRLKGLLYESALEMAEISNEEWFTKDAIDRLFGRKMVEASSFVIDNFYLKDYEALRKDWKYLQSMYPELFNKEVVLDSYSDLRFQTSIDKKTGTTVEGSLHNIRVVDKGTLFTGSITLLHQTEEGEKILTYALKNLRFAGVKRNRGFGHIRCEVVAVEGV